LGVVALSFHLGNGLWSFCIMWGITITRKSQKLMFMAGMGLFVALSIAGTLSAMQLGGWLGDPPFADPKTSLHLEVATDRANEALAEVAVNWAEGAEPEDVNRRAGAVQRALDELTALHESGAEHVELELALKRLQLE